MGKTTNILDLNNRLTKVEKENVAQNNYNSLKNRPKINGNLLTGDKTGAQLGLAEAQEVGNLNALNTTDKSSCVAAINEVNSSSSDTVNIDPTYAVSGSNWEIERYGKLRILRIKNLQSIPSGSTVIGSVSSQDFPSKTLQITVYGSTKDSHYNVYVTDTGVIAIYNFSQTTVSSEVLMAELVYVV